MKNYPTNLQLWVYGFQDISLGDRIDYELGLMGFVVEDKYSPDSDECGGSIVTISTPICFLLNGSAGKELCENGTYDANRPEPLDLSLLLDEIKRRIYAVSDQEPGVLVEHEWQDANGNRIRNKKR